MLRLLQNPWTLSVLIVLGLAGWMISGQLSSAQGEGDDGEMALRGAAGAGPAAAAAAGERDERLTSVQYREQRGEVVERRLVISARAEASRRVVVKAQTSGRVTSTDARRGSRLQQGEVVMRLELADREARLTEAKARVRQRELEYEAQQKLEPSGFNSAAALAEALALLEAARAELTRAELDLARMVVTAPFDGALEDRSVEVGDYVTPGDPLFTYLDDRTVIVAGDVSENDIAALQVGMPGTAELVDGTRAEGTLRYIAPLADTATRTFPVELELTDAQQRIPLGATARLTLGLEQVNAHAVSPALLVLDDAGELGLKVIDRANRVQFVHVELVRAEPDTVWVSGLPDPARIITVGQGFVTEGERVAPQAEARETRTAAGEPARPGDPLDRSLTAAGGAQP